MCQALGFRQCLDSVIIGMVLRSKLHRLPQPRLYILTLLDDHLRRVVPQGLL